MKVLKRVRFGFTMIEIMVVVVIVAILAAIALPIYLDYVQSSYASEARTVMSNVHNLSLIHISEPTRLLSIGYGVICV